MNTFEHHTERCFRNRRRHPAFASRWSPSYGFAISDVDDLPDQRTSLVGHTDEQDEAWLIRSISQKLYRCPGCHGEIAIGEDHVVCQRIARIGGTEHHHWHRRCAITTLLPTLHNVRKVSASASERDKLERRGGKTAGRRRRPY